MNTDANCLFRSSPISSWLVAQVSPLYPWVVLPSPWFPLFFLHRYKASGFSLIPTLQYHFVALFVSSNCSMIFFLPAVSMFLKGPVWFHLYKHYTGFLFLFLLNLQPLVIQVPLPCHTYPSLPRHASPGICNTRSVALQVTHFQVHAHFILEKRAVIPDVLLPS